MSDDRDNESRTASDAPVDLAKERETFVRSFLRKGVELTEELLKENVDLRDEMQRLRRDNARLRAQVASDDAIRELLNTIERLEREKGRLLDTSEKLVAAQQTDESRYQEIERELNDLANLYVASYQLHQSMSVRRVVRHLLDMLGQLVGAYSFAIYVVTPDGKRIEPIASENLEGLEPVTMGEGAIGEACMTGLARIPDRLRSGSVDDPMLILPIMAEGRAVGAITVVSMLAQKKGWATVDHELFKLLGAHAGPALIGANLYAAVGQPFQALTSLSENLKKRGSYSPPADDE